MIKILDFESGQRIGVARYATSCTRVEEINGENTLDFSAVFSETIANLIKDDSVYEVDDDYFDTAIVQKQANTDGTYTVDVEAEHVSYRLNNPEFDLESFLSDPINEETGQPLGTLKQPVEVLNEILKDTGFELGEIQFNVAPHVYNVTSATSRRRLLIDYIDLLRGEVHFDKYIVNVLVKRGSTAPVLVIEGEHVKTISREFNRRQLDQNRQPSISYNCQPIGIALEKLKLGDVVTLHNKVLNINTASRVIRRSHNPYIPTETMLTFGTYISGFERPLHEVGHIVERVDNLSDQVEEMEEELEEVVNQMPQKLRLTEYDFNFRHNLGVFETNFDAIDTTKMFPSWTGGKRQFIRIGNTREGNELTENEKIQWIETALEAADEEDPTKILDSQMHSHEGEPIYWTAIDKNKDSFFHQMPWVWIDPITKEEIRETIEWTEIDHEPYTRATILDPLDFRSIMFPPNMPSDEREKIRVEVRYRYAVTIRKVVEGSKKSLAEIMYDRDTETLYFTKESEEGRRGLRVTDDGVVQFTEKETGEWYDVGTGEGGGVPPGGANGDVLTRDHSAPLGVVWGPGGVGDGVIIERRI